MGHEGNITENIIMLQWYLKLLSFATIHADFRHCVEEINCHDI